MITDFILARHGETEANAAGIWQGHMDGQLSARGREQAQALARRLKGLEFAAVYSSDLSRAMDTAGAVVALSGHEVRVDARLRERHLGVFQGLTPEQSAQIHPEAWKAHRTGDPDNIVPEGESASQHRARAMECFYDVARRHAGETVVVVTHGGTLSGLLRFVAGIPMHLPRAWANPNCGFNRVEFDHETGRWLIRVWADVSHLTGVPVEDVALER